MNAFLPEDRRKGPEVLLNLFTYNTSEGGKVIYHRPLEEDISALGKEIRIGFLRYPLKENTGGHQLVLRR